MRAIAVTAALLGLACPALVFAQDAERPVASIVLGPSPHNLDGTGTGFIGAARVDFHPERGFVIEPGLGLYSFQPAPGQTAVMTMLELSFQGELQWKVRPYAGVGLGTVETTASTTHPNDFLLTVHAAAGIRVPVHDWVICAEVRVRSFESWGWSSDYTIGLGRRIG